MNRRAFLSSPIVVVSLCSPGSAQGNMRKVGILTPAEIQWDRNTFLDELEQRGYARGRNLELEIRSAEGVIPRLKDLARELLAARPDVLVGVNSPSLKEIIDAGASVPVVAAMVGDPIALGLVDNLARPRGNVTGVANLGADLTIKRLALLKEAVPKLERVALFFHPEDPVVAPQLRQLDAAALPLGLELASFPMRSESEVGRNIDAAAQQKAGAILRLAGQGLTLGPITGRLATEAGLHTMLLDKASVEAGGLMSYVASYDDLWRRVAGQVDQLLRGTPVAEIPFEQPSKFTMAINLTAAKRLGLMIPPSLLARADAVIE